MVYLLVEMLVGVLIIHLHRSVHPVCAWVLSGYSGLLQSKNMHVLSTGDSGCLLLLLTTGMGLSKKIKILQ